MTFKKFKWLEFSITLFLNSIIYLLNYLFVFDEEFQQHDLSNNNGLNQKEYLVLY